MRIKNKSHCCHHCHCCRCDDCLPCVVIIIAADDDDNDDVVVVSSFDTLADLFNTYFRDKIGETEREREKEMFLSPSMTKAGSLAIAKSKDGVVGLNHQ